MGADLHVADLNLDCFRQVIDLNVIGPVVAMQAVILIMREHGGGLIMNVSSMATRMHIPCVESLESVPLDSLFTNV